MTLASRWSFLGVSIAIWIAGAPALRAQPSGEPAPASDEPIIVDDGPTRPWSRGVSLEDRSAARELFREGNRLMRTPLPARAAEQYNAALALWKHPVFYFNLAVAQIALGQEVEARENLERALAHGEEPYGPDKLREVQHQLREVTRQLGQLRVRCQVPGAEVTLDGATLFIGPGSYEGWAKAKPYALTAKKAGYLAEARRVTVSPGQVQDIELKPVTLSEATDTSRRWAAWKPWAVVAAGGLIAATGGAFHALAARSFNAYDEQFLRLECVTMPEPAPGCAKDRVPLDLSDRLKLARRQQAIAVGGYIAGGSLIAVGVALLYWNRPRLMEQEAARSSTGSVAVVPLVSTDMVGISVSVNP